MKVWMALIFREMGDGTVQYIKDEGRHGREVEWTRNQAKAKRFGTREASGVLRAVHAKHGSWDMEIELVSERLESAQAA